MTERSAVCMFCRQGLHYDDALEQRDVVWDRLGEHERTCAANPYLALLREARCFVEEFAKRHDPECFASLGADGLIARLNCLLAPQDAVLTRVWLATASLPKSWWIRFSIAEELLHKLDDATLAQKAGEHVCRTLREKMRRSADA